MKTWCIGIALSVFLAGAAIAQTVTIRSGEHDGYTRLVLNLPSHLKWKMENRADDHIVSFDAKGLSFDTTTVFDRIARNRITNLSTDPESGSLVLSLGCDCDISSFWHGETLLVFDIRGPKEATQLPSEPAPARPAPVATQVDKAPSPSPALELPQGQASVAIALISKDLSSQPGIPVQGTPISPIMTAKNNRIAETRDRLLKQFSRAASQGLLSPRASPNSLQKPREKETEPNTEADATTPDEAMAMNPGKNLAANINLKAQSSIDRDFLSVLANDVQSMGSSVCLNPALIDIAAWGTDAPFAHQIGAQRKALFKEFDKTSENAALALAKAYLFFGFGAEALQILRLISDPEPELAVLYSMALILEQGHAPTGSAFSGQLECDSAAALWSALSYQSLPSDMAIDTDAIVRSFNALPEHLRRYLGPGLSRRFLLASRQDISLQILRILDRNTLSKTPQSQLAKADVEMSKGDTEKAENTLSEVVDTGAQPSAEALVKMIESRLATNQEISFDVAQLAGAYAHENRGKPIAKHLVSAYVRALASAEAFDQSYNELVRFGPDLSDESNAIIRSNLIWLLAENADEMTFLRHVLAGHGGDGTDLDPKIGNAVAARLLQAGFAFQARQFVSTPATGSWARARDLLRAQISLKEGRPRQAEFDLLGMSGPDVNLLRAQARSMVGQHNAAYHLFASADKTADARREAWLAGDLNVLAKSQEPVVANLATLIKTNSEGDDANTVEAAGGTLARNRKLVDESLAIRGALDALLTEKPMPGAVAD